MELNAGFPPSMSKRMNMMAVTTTMAPIIDSSGVAPGSLTSMAGPQTALYEPFQQHILQLKEQQRLQEQLLLQQFNAQRQHLAEQYEKQLQQSLQAYMERQKAVAHQQQQQQQMMEEEAARERDAEKLEALKNKDKSAQSAVASSEVKQRLQEFLLNKNQREAAVVSASGSAGASTCSGSPPIRNWHHSLMKKYEEDYPLRKTASEPNLKVRLKQRVIERRSSPLRRRKDRHHLVKRRSQLAIDSTSAGSTPDSGPSSPPSLVGPSSALGGGTTAGVGHSQQQQGTSAASSIQEEGASTSCDPYSNQHQLANANMQLMGSVSDLTASLYSSPSMPNISLGRPPSASSSMDGPKLPTLSEAEMKLRLGIPPGNPAGSSASSAANMLPVGVFHHPLYAALPTADESAGALPFASPNAGASASPNTGTSASPNTGTSASPNAGTSSASPNTGASTSTSNSNITITSTSTSTNSSASTSTSMPQMTKQHHMSALEQVGLVYPPAVYPHPGPITDVQVAHARLSKTNPGRPLNRTQSAPLPLGHPMLQSHAAAAAAFMQQQQQQQQISSTSAHLLPIINSAAGPAAFPAAVAGLSLGHSAVAHQLQLEQFVRDRQLFLEQAQHSLMKQQLRATVLTRAGSKNHVENVEEETEAAVAQEMLAVADTDAGQDLLDEHVMDLTGAGGAGAGTSASTGASRSYKNNKQSASSYHQHDGSMRRSESLSLESDLLMLDYQQQQQQQLASRLAGAKSDLERHVLSRKAARGDPSAAAALLVFQNQQQQHHQHLQQQQQKTHHSTDLINRSHQQHQQHPSSSTTPEALPGSSGSMSSAFRRSHHTIRPLSRALSSPLVTLGSVAGSAGGSNGGKADFPSHEPSLSTTTPASATSRATLSGSSSPPVLRPRSFGGLHQQQLQHRPRQHHVTALAYDSLMLKHQCSCGDNSSHPEHSGRLQSIWARLQETGLVTRCERIRPRKATLEEIQVCHVEAHTLLFGTSPLSRQRLDWNKLANAEGGQALKNFVVLPCGGIGVDSDTTWDELHTASAARMAVGCVMELAFRVGQGEASNGFAVVRPPGHHAEPSQAMGFCFFNNVAIAAKHVRYQLGLEKILILDWDVHHGNGTQQMFYDDCHVLYLSIHRHDLGNFFPGTGGSIECGVDDGNGFTVNVAWSGSLNPPMSDAEYLAAFRTIVIPIVQDFNPEMILVSCGFDAARGHPAPLGGYNLSPACYAHMTRALMQFAHGKVVLALEGGYSLPAMCDASAECVRALLGDKLPAIEDAELRRKPCQEAIDILQKTIAIQASHWPVIKRWAHLVNMSAVEAATHLLPGASVGVDRGPDPRQPTPAALSLSSLSSTSSTGAAAPQQQLPAASTLVSHKRSLYGRKSDSTEESETVSAMASLSVHHPQHMSPPPAAGRITSPAAATIRAASIGASIVKMEPVSVEPMDEDPVK